MTSRLVNKFPSPPLQKSEGYNLDLAVVGGTDFIWALFVALQCLENLPSSVKFAKYVACFYKLS